MKQVVLDASIILKWYLPNEEFADKALSYLQQIVNNQIEIICPSLLPYEVLNGLLIAQRRGRIEPEVTITAMEGLLEVGLSLEDTFQNYEDILSFSQLYQRTAYDAAYLSLAKGRNIDLITGDIRLYNAVKHELNWVKWIGSVVV